MNRFALTLCAASVALASAGMPTVSKVSSSQTLSSRAVNVEYTIADEAAIVTLAVQTNRGDGVYVDIGDANLTHAVGDVNVRVGVGDHKLLWYPDKAWPDHVLGPDMIRVGVKAWPTNAPPDYMVVSLDFPSNVTYYTSAEGVPGGVKDVRYKTTHLLMRKIPARGVVWQMGSLADEDVHRQADYETLRNVTLTEDYYIGVYELTQGQFMRINGSYWESSNYKDAATRDVHPQENMGRDAFRGAGATYRWPQDGHAVNPSGRIGKLRNKTGLLFDLPTSAQWEYACRAGRSGKWATETLGAGGWYLTNGGAVSHEVGLKEPNDWGLYDMQGNIGEFTLDVFDKIASVGSVTVVDPTGPDDAGSSHVIRGGSFAQEAYDCRMACNLGFADNVFKFYLGFRLWAPAVQPY